jgi:hypothetical protein
VSQLPEQLTITPSKTPFKSIVLILIVSLANTPVPLYNITAHTINRKHSFLSDKAYNLLKLKPHQHFATFTTLSVITAVSASSSDSIISNLISSYKRIILKFRLYQAFALTKSPLEVILLGRTMSPTNCHSELPTGFRL